MTEEEWLTSGTLSDMLAHLSKRQRWDRHVGMFLMACCRQVEPLIPVDVSAVIEAGERYAAGLITKATLQKWMRKMGELVLPNAGAVWTALWCLGENRYQYHPGRVVGVLVREARRRKVRGKVEDIAATIEARLCELCRDIVGNPFQSQLAHNPAWLTAQTGVAGRLAHSIYEERRFTELPILADALEDAGCTEQCLLDHFRGPGPHERGCWALDVVLGKE
jgi:hypothetical protein